MRKGFTLVELAIVITIIGLLIGGVLKGQELLENARMTSTGSQLKAMNGASITFKDIYKAYAGDIRDPANFIEGCTTAPCNISGNGDGLIGLDTVWGVSDENNNFFLHLAKAKLISGVNPNSTWGAGTHFGVNSSQPPISIGGRINMVNMTYCIRSGTPGHYWHSFQRGTSDGQAVGSVPHDKVLKYDLKFDDGKPLTGTVVLHCDYALAADGVNYDPNVKVPVWLLEKAEF